MTELQLAPAATESPCWDRIGVYADGSCARLADVTHCRNCPVYAAAGRELARRPPPPGYTEQWTARIAEPDAPPDVATVAVVLFQVSGEWYALEVGFAVEVSPMRPIRRVPHQSRQSLAGLVNLRGELQLVVSVAGLLGLPPCDAPERMLVIERAGERWVVLADRVEDIVHVPESEIGPLPATVAAGRRPLTRGVLPWRGHAVGLLDPGQLFAALAGVFQ